MSDPLVGVVMGSHPASRPTAPGGWCLSERKGCDKAGDAGGGQGDAAPCHL